MSLLKWYVGIFMNSQTALYKGLVLFASELFFCHDNLHVFYCENAEICSFLRIILCCS